MTWRTLFASPVVRAACFAVLLAVLLAAYALSQALHHQDVAAAPPTVNVVAGALAPANLAAAIDISSAASADLFAADRAAAPVRYRMPGEPPPPKAADDPALPVVLGTAIAPDGSSFATCQYQSSRLLMLRVGDHVGVFTVKSISREKVAFALASGRSFEVLAPRAGS